MIDVEALDELRDALGEALDEIMEQFALQLDDQIDEIRVALAAPDLHAVKVIAHSLKGGACNFGATRLTAAAFATEMAARANDLARARAAFAELARAKRATESALVELGYFKPR